MKDDIKEVRPLTGYEAALCNAPDLHVVSTTYQRREVVNDAGKKVWRQFVVRRKVADEKGVVLYDDNPGF